MRKIFSVLTASLILCGIAHAETQVLCEEARFQNEPRQGKINKLERRANYRARHA